MRKVVFIIIICMLFGFVVGYFWGLWNSSGNTELRVRRFCANIEGISSETILSQRAESLGLKYLTSDQTVQKKPSKEPYFMAWDGNDLFRWHWCCFCEMKDGKVTRTEITPTDGEDCFLYVNTEVFP